MPEDTLTLRTDPTNSFDVLQRLGTGYQQFGRNTDRVGESFIRSERAARAATANIVSGLTSVNNAADASLLIFQGLERVFKIGLIPAVGAAAAIAGVAALRKEAKELELAVQAVRKELRNPLSLDIQLSPEDITARIESVTKATQELEKKKDSIGTKTLKFFAGPLLSSASAIDKELNDAILDGSERRVALSHALADSELKLANIKSRQVDAEKDLTGITKDQIDIERLGIEIEQKRAKLLEDFIGKGGIAIDVYQRMLAVQVTIGAQIKKDIADIATKRDTIAGDIGSGKFLKDLQQKRQKESDQIAGRSQAQGFADAAAKGIPLGPDAQAILDAARSSGLVEDPNKPIVPIPGGRTADVGESQDLVNQIEKNKQTFDAFNPIIDEASKQMQQINSDSTLSPDDMKRMMDTGDESGTTVDANRELEQAASEAATSLSQLSQLDFTGIMSLNGLVISIQ